MGATLELIALGRVCQYDLMINTTYSNTVVPAQAGIHTTPSAGAMDPRLRGDDGES